MADFPATITAVGLIARAALVALGMTAQPAKIEIGLGQYTPTGAEIALMTPFNPVREFTDDMTGHVAGTSTIEVGWQDPTDDVYNIGEIGFFLSDGTLFAISSQPVADGFLDVKTGGGTFYIANLQFDGQSLDDITFPASSTAVIHATTAASGIMRFGTKPESRGTSEALGMTPGGLQGAVWDPPFATAAENLNNVKYRTPGIYALDDVDTIANSPVTSTGGQTGIVMVWPLSAISPQSNLVQEFFCGYPEGEVGKWMRFRLSGAWQSWVKFGSVLTGSAISSLIDGFIGTGWRSVLSGSAISSLIDGFIGTGWRQAPGTPVTYSAADIRDLYESNANRNAFTDALRTMLQGAAPLNSPSFSGVPTVPDQSVGANNQRIANTRFVAAAVAASVLTGSAISSLIDGAIGTGWRQVLTGSAISSLIDGVIGTGWRQAPGTPVTYSAADIRDLYESNANRNAFSDALLSKLNGVESNATGDLSANEIRDLYESNANRNAFTDALRTMLQGAAPLNSPSFSGVPTVPDQSVGANNQRIANTRFVAAAVAALVASAPNTLNTLNELADALGDDPNFATTITNMIANIDTGPTHITQTSAPTTQEIADAAEGTIWLVYAP